MISEMAAVRNLTGKAAVLECCKQNSLNIPVGMWEARMPTGMWAEGCNQQLSEGAIIYQELNYRSLTKYKYG